MATIQQDKNAYKQVYAKLSCLAYNALGYRLLLYANALVQMLFNVFSSGPNHQRNSGQSLFDCFVCHVLPNHAAP